MGQFLATFLTFEAVEQCVLGIDLVYNNVRVVCALYRRMEATKTTRVTPTTALVMPSDRVVRVASALNSSFCYSLMAEYWPHRQSSARLTHFALETTTSSPISNLLDSQRLRPCLTMSSLKHPKSQDDERVLTGQKTGHVTSNKAQRKHLSVLC